MTATRNPPSSIGCGHCAYHRSVCADPRRAADLVAAVLTALEGGDTKDAAAKCRRQENRPRTSAGGTSHEVPQDPAISQDAECGVFAHAPPGAGRGRPSSAPHCWLASWEADVSAGWLEMRSCPPPPCPAAWSAGPGRAQAGSKGLDRQQCCPVSLLSYVNHRPRGGRSSAGGLCARAVARNRHLIALGERCDVPCIRLLIIFLEGK